MPLTRYQIRNEYSLADPELYKAADKDDPEALLEGVAMAGLVGVLRQLGDLAEFAAEIFHDLHEEVMATAARGHGLMIRVQQLEAEVPAIEKAFLSQTNHTPFFSNTGEEWHPNMHMEQNLVTRGDLPRCVMDSYEECRGPPRLFLLDKFDVAGAGACLKRYTDPSFLKASAASSEIPPIDGHKEKKNRKVKKRGSRWRNGETPEVAPTSHPKLHQLFLEEQVEKGQSDPARLVKLKKRQLNASPFDSRSGKSYMEKFLESSPETNVVHEISVHPLPLKLTSDNSSESGLEIYDISTVSPMKKSSEGKENTYSSPDMQELRKPSVEELYGEVIDRQIISEATTGTDEVSSTLHQGTLEKVTTVDVEGKHEGSIDGYRSDDMASEVDNYMDALATMESEMETENEYRLKNDVCFSNVKHGTDSDRNEEQLESEANFSDSQSLGNFSTSDEGNTSVKRGRSSVSYSDTHSNMADNTPSDNEGSKLSSSSVTLTTETKYTPSHQSPEDAEIKRTECHDFVLPTDCVDGNGTRGLGELSFNSSSMDPDMVNLPSDPETVSVQNNLDGIPSESVNSGYELSNVKTETNLVDSSSVGSDTALHVKHGDADSEVGTESCNLDKVDSRYPDLSSSGLPALSNNKSGEFSGPLEVRTDSVGDSSMEDRVGDNNITHQPITSTLEQSHCQTTPEVVVNSGFTSLDDNSDAVQHADAASEIDDSLQATDVHLDKSTSTTHSTEVDVENSTSETVGFEDQQLSDISNGTEVEFSTTKKAALSDVEEDAELEEISTFAISKKEDISIWKVDGVDAEEGSAVSPGYPSFSDGLGTEDHVRLHDAMTKNVVEADHLVVSDKSFAALGDFPPSISAGDSTDDIVCSSTEIVHSPSNGPANLQNAYYDVLESNQEESDIKGPASDLQESSYELLESNQEESDIKGPASNLQESRYEVLESEQEESHSNGPASNLRESRHDVFESNQEESHSNGPASNLQESRHDVLESNQEESHMHGPALINCVGGSETVNETSQSDVAFTHVDHGSCKLVSFEDSNLEMPDGVVNSSSLADTNWTGSHAGDEVMAPASSGLSDHVPQPNYTQQNILPADRGDAVSSPTANQPDVESLSEQSLRWQAAKLDLESLRGEESSSNPPDHYAEQMVSPSHSNQESYCNDSIVSCQEDLLIQPSPSVDIPQLIVNGLNRTEEVSDPIGNTLPSFGLLNVETPVNIEEMPPLPPLPPMQWRLGKFQTPLFSQRGVSENSQGSFPSILPPSNDQKIEAPQGFTMPPGNPFSSFTDVEDKESYASELVVSNELPHTLSSMQLRTTANGGADSQLNSLAITETQSFNPFLTLSGFPNMKPEDGVIASDGQVVQSTANPFVSMPTVEYTASRQDLDVGNLVHPPNQLASEAMEDSTLQQTLQNSDKEQKNSSDTSAVLPIKVDEHPQHDLPTPELESSQASSSSSAKQVPQQSANESQNPSDTAVLPAKQTEEQPQRNTSTSEREMSLPSNQVAVQHTSNNSAEEHQTVSNTSVLPPQKVEQPPQHGLSTSERESSWPLNPFALLPTSEAAKTNGSSVPKIPRPRNPLIDSVAALDKSKLRKVSERDRTENSPKVDERDSWLEQIRTRSFNLKPAVVTRPSIQGPSTNLKVAAILEKAIAIRQATAGSDEDDEDEWSDS